MTPRILAALAAALALAVPIASANGGARVWISSEHPLVVRGSGFHDGTRVTVVVSKLKQSMRMSMASNTSGGFTARFGSNLPARCGTTVVTATASDGQRAISRIVANDCGGIKLPAPGPATRLP